MSQFRQSRSVGIFSCSPHMQRQRYKSSSMITPFQDSELLPAGFPDLPAGYCIMAGLFRIASTNRCTSYASLSGWFRLLSPATCFGGRTPSDVSILNCKPLLSGFSVGKTVTAPTTGPLASNAQSRNRTASLRTRPLPLSPSRTDLSHPTWPLPPASRCWPRSSVFLICPLASAGNLPRRQLPSV